MTGRILIVDPLPTNRIALKAKLVAAHFEVAVTATVASARILDGETPFDAVLVAAGLVTRDAACALLFSEQLARQPDRIVTTIILRDAMPNAEAGDFVAKCLRGGVRECLTRPFATEVLLSRLRNLMRDDARAYDMRLTPESGGLAHPPSPTGDAVGRPRARIAIALVEPLQVVSLASGRSELADELASELTEHLPAGDSVEVQPVAKLMQRDTRLESHGVIVMMAAKSSEENAISLLTQIKSRSRSPGARVILVLQEPTTSQLTRAYDLGADDVVAAGASRHEICARVDHQARLHAADAARRQTVRDRLRMAVTDPLTGLHNRRYATEMLEAMIQDSRASGRSFAVLALDVDHFKRVNDRYGHGVGDLVLCEIAQALRCNLREGDLIARSGGEEFIAALPRADRAQALAMANRLRRAIGKLEIQVGNGQPPIRVTLSIGLAFHDGAGQIRHLLEHADHALYAAKARGRNVVAMSAATAA